jgi:Ethanolamine utilization protein EutJ (predicted chaperonin)
MAKKGKKENIIVGLDVGTTKISAIVGEVNDNGVEIIGIGTQPSRGMRKGVVINIDATVESPEPRSPPFTAPSPAATSAASTATGSWR